jgi:hypothetical protein
MSMTTANAKIYVARIIAGANMQNALDMAGEAIQRAYQEWEAKKFWRFLLKDTSNGFRVAACSCTSGSAVVSAPSTGAFDAVNPGVVVTVLSSDTVTLAASTTVLSLTYNTDGTVATMTLSANFGGTTDTSTTLIFAGDIPIVAGTRTYNLPTDYNASFGARMLVNKRELVWKDIRVWDRMIVDQTAQSFAQEYTTYNPFSDLTQNFGQNRLMLDVPPSEADTLNLKYYRSFNKTGTNVDIPDNYLYMFLDYARARLLETKNALQNPAQFIASSEKSQETAAENDEQATDNDDDDCRMKSIYEVGMSRNLWSNGQFDPYQ